MTVGIYASSLTFSDGTAKSLNPDDIVVLCGPNNSGKSSALRELARDVLNGAVLGPVIKGASYSVKGDLAQLKSYMTTTFKLRDLAGQMLIPGTSIAQANLDPWFQQGLRNTPLSSLFVTHLDTEQRLRLCAPTQREDLTRAEPVQPLSVLEIDSPIETKISKLIHDAFGFNIILNRAGGSTLELMICNGDAKYSREQYHRTEYHNWITTLQRLNLQGDGVRSFTGIVLSLLTRPKSLIIIDEPEAFLHPPQAREIAQIIAKEVSADTQLIIATHSDDFIRGLLDAESKRIRILRVQRLTKDGNEINRISSLEHDAIKELWGDAILRTSDVLSGLFHQAAIIVEGETDARFFRALLDAMVDAKSLKVPDVRFYYGTGVGSVAKMVTGLRAVAVPVITILDQDVICSKTELTQICEAIGGDFSQIKDDYGILMAYLNGTTEQITTEVVEAKVHAVFAKVDKNSQFSPSTKSQITAAVEIATFRDKLKTKGRAFLLELLQVAKGGVQETKVREAIDAYDRIIVKLHEFGILFCIKGELEGFSPDDLPKSGWLDRVLARNLVTDQKLTEVRSFATTLNTSIRKAIDGS